MSKRDTPGMTYEIYRGAYVEVLLFFFSVIMCSCLVLLGSVCTTSVAYSVVYNTRDLIGWCHHVTIYLYAYMSYICLPVDLAVPFVASFRLNRRSQLLPLQLALSPSPLLPPQQRLLLQLQVSKASWLLSF